VEIAIIGTQFSWESVGERFWKSVNIRKSYEKSTNWLFFSGTLCTGRYLCVYFILSYSLVGSAVQWIVRMRQCSWSASYLSHMLHLTNTKETQVIWYLALNV